MYLNGEIRVPWQYYYICICVIFRFAALFLVFLMLRSENDELSLRINAKTAMCSEGGLWKMYFQTDFLAWDQACW